MENKYIRQQTSFMPLKTHKFKVTNQESGLKQLKSDKKISLEKASSKCGHGPQKRVNTHMKLATAHTPEKSDVASQDDLNHKMSHGNCLEESKPEQANQADLEMNFDTSKSI